MCTNFTYRIKKFSLGTQSGRPDRSYYFFLISGLLITFLLLKEEKKTGTISLRNFFVRRSLRVFPVFYALLLVYFILQSFGVLQINQISWITSLTYTKYFITDASWEMGHFWSLSVEEHFYLVWAFVFLYLKPFRTWFAFAVIIACVLLRLTTGINAVHIFTRADAIMVGCLFAIYYDRLVLFIRNQPAILRWATFVVFILCTTCGQHLMPFISVTYRKHMTLALTGSHGLFTDLSIGLIILISINYTDNLYFKLLNWRPADYLGQISYSIYIWQQLYFSDKIGALSHLPLNIFLIIISAVLSFNFVEKPFLRLKDKFSRKELCYPEQPALNCLMNTIIRLKNEYRAKPKDEAIGWNS
jgi:peptidoglycan/LPS O-acetylase OafA/YrhL